MTFKSLGLHHPFFRPLSRRILTVVVIAIYGAVELVYGHPGWAAFALCLVVLCCIAFFVIVDPEA